MASWDLLQSPVLLPEASPSHRAGQPDAQEAAHVQRFNFELVHRAEGALEDCSSPWTWVARPNSGLGPWSANWVMVERPNDGWEFVRGRNRFPSFDVRPEAPPTQDPPHSTCRGRSRCTRDAPSWALGEVGIIGHALQELRCLPNRSRDSWSGLQKAGKPSKAGPGETLSSPERLEQSFEMPESVAACVCSEEECPATWPCDPRTPSSQAAGNHVTLILPVLM